jgi:hypothetical protein
VKIINIEKDDVMVMGDGEPGGDKSREEGDGGKEKSRV